ncbi:MAG TPA: response regulator [bacterium]|nr:response regulator [bacterium]HOZ21454.1 response regulator [bacterium]
MSGHNSPKQNILIVDTASAATTQLVSALHDHDLESVVVEESTAAIERALAEPPLLILSEVELPGIDGTELLKRVRAHADTQDTPFVFITRQTELEARLRLLALEIDDFIAKPYYPEEVVARVESILRESAVTPGGDVPVNQGFTGSLDEMTVMDLIQTLELGKKSAMIHLVQVPEEGYLFVDKGEVVDAVLRDYTAEEALDNLMLWLHGYFELTMQPVQRERRILRSNRELLLAGAQRLHDYRTRSAQLPAMDSYVARAAEVINPDLSEREARLWAILERPQPVRLLIASLGEDELRTIEVIQALWERKQIVISPGKATDADLIASNMMRQVSESHHKSAEPYSRMASFFTRDGHQKKNLS